MCFEQLWYTLSIRVINKRKKIKCLLSYYPSPPTASFTKNWKSAPPGAKAKPSRLAASRQPTASANFQGPTRALFFILYFRFLFGYIKGTKQGLVTMDRKSIANLKVYRSALAIERQVISHTLYLEEEKFYDWGNDLHRSAAGICHYIKQAHEDYSYQLKIESLHHARRSGEDCLRLIEEAHSKSLSPLVTELTAVVKQIWGLIKYLKLKQAERQQAVNQQSSDELVAARRRS